MKFVQGQVGIADRAFNYGDGCFTTMRYESGAVQLLERHLKRLQHDAGKLGINNINIKTIREQIQLTLSRLDANTTCVIKVLISRGEGGRGYAPSTDSTPVVAITVHDFLEHPVVSQRDQGLKLCCSSVHLSQQTLLAGIKHTSRLEQVLAKQDLQRLNTQAAEQAIDDVLLCHFDGTVVEASAANVFWFDGQGWFTPDLRFGGVAGVMRSFVIDVIDLEAAHIVACKLETLKDAKAMFTCNALQHILPVESLLLQGTEINFDLAPSLAVSKRVQTLLQQGVDE